MPKLSSKDEQNFQFKEGDVDRFGKPKVLLSYKFPMPGPGHYNSVEAIKENKTTAVFESRVLKGIESYTSLNLNPGPA